MIDPKTIFGDENWRISLERKEQSQTKAQLPQNYRVKAEGWYGWWLCICKYNCPKSCSPVIENAKEQNLCRRRQWKLPESAWECQLHFPPEWLAAFQFRRRDLMLFGRPVLIRTICLYFSFQMCYATATKGAELGKGSSSRHLVQRTNPKRVKFYLKSKTNVRKRV